MKLKNEMKAVKKVKAKSEAEPVVCDRIKLLIVKTYVSSSGGKTG